jgi:hypothetical protein
VENLNKFTHILVGEKAQEAINIREITINMAKTNSNQNKGLNEPPQTLEVLILHETSEMKQKCETCMRLPEFLTGTRSASLTSVHIFYRTTKQ